MPYLGEDWSHVLFRALVLLTSQNNNQIRRMVFFIDGGNKSSPFKVINTHSLQWVGGFTESQNIQLSPVWIRTVTFSQISGSYLKSLCVWTFDLNQLVTSDWARLSRSLVVEKAITLKMRKCIICIYATLLQWTGWDTNLFSKGAKLV